MFWTREFVTNVLTAQNFCHEFQIVQEMQEVVKTKIGISYDRRNWLG